MMDQVSDSFEKDRIINNYRIISKLGAGGMGEVYLAEDAKLGRPVAVKFLNPEFGREPDKLNRFIYEAKAVSALNHPNILTVYEIGEAGGVNYLATEYIEGETLREIIARRETLSPETILTIAIQIAEALAAAHASGIVHRDIKPENVMRRADGYVKVLDFGLAKLFQPPAIGKEEITLVHSNPGVLRGTVSYMSPEQARGLAVDNRTDIWSFGVVFYELAALRLPFAGETATDVILSIVQQEPFPLAAAAPDLPEEFYTIVENLLRKKTVERYQRIDEVLSDLRRLKQKLDYQLIERNFPPEDLKISAGRKLPSEKTHAAAFAENTTISAESNFAARKFENNNLSLELSPLIGRGRESAEIAGLLNRADLRLLTITGVGGTGKTRLARFAAYEALGNFSDGVYFVALAAIESGELFLPVVAQTLDVQEERGRPLSERLRDTLRDKKMLLVLDNFEQIADAAPQIGELLAASPALKIIVTSRVRLYLPYEHEFPLEPLAIPAAEESLELDRLKENPAIQLFVARAQTVKLSFALTEENAPAVAEICRRLDGLPLAVELAAVRIKLLAPPAILARLSKSLQLLTGGARDLPERRQTMRGAIRWSYDLLELEEQKLFRRLAVFAGGFTLDAAEAIFSAAENARDAELLDGAASLVDKSLLAQRETTDGEPRFRMLQVVREFALETLADNLEADEIRKFHAEFYAGLAEQAEPELLRKDAARWMETLEEEHDNLRAALEWSLSAAPEIALRIVAALNGFWIRRGYLSEGVKWTKQALETSAGESSDALLRAKIYTGIGNFSWRQGLLAEAEPFFRKSLAAARAIDDKILIGIALEGFGGLKNIQGELDAAGELMREALAIAREIGDKSAVSLRLNSLGEIARTQGDFRGARDFYEESLVLARQESVKLMISISAVNLAAVACQEKNFPAARALAHEALEISEELGDKITLGHILGMFAALAAEMGEPEKAAQMFGAADAVHAATGYKLYEVDQTFFDLYNDRTRRTLGDAAYHAAFRKGQTLHLKKAIAIARAELDK